MNKCEQYCHTIKRLCNGEPPLLPREYQQVDYLINTAAETSDKPYINTGIAANTIKGMVIKYAQYYGGVTDDYSYGFGSNDNSNANIYCCCRKEDLITLSIRGPSVSSTYTMATGVDHVISLLDNKLYIDEAFRGNITPICTSSTIMMLFNSGYKTSASSYTRISYCQLYTSAGLVRDMYACYRKSDREPGMYDLVSNTFFTNVGTGAFTVGSNT